ncbi:retrovirus-related pol polyprotein from transposon TNT 1-94, partial [Tanacetum coccineum]
AMQEELNHFNRNNVWTLIPLLRGKIAIGSKWVFRNKKDELGTVIRNKTRLVAQGYSQEEEIDYDETFTPVARTEAIRMSNNVMFLKVASSLTIEFHYYVCKLDKALYGLKQAPKAWDLLKKYEISDISSEKTSMVIPNDSVPDLSYKPVNEIYQANPKESHLNDVKRIFRYLKGTPTHGLWYPKCSGFDLKGYPDLDYAGCNMDMNSTSSACQLLGGRLMF